MFHPLIEPLEARIAPATFAILTPAHIPEGDSSTQDLVFTVSLAGPITSDVTVAFATADGTATTTDGDYTARSGTLIFQPGGEMEQLISVPVRGDFTDELTETFTVALSAPTGEATLDPAATSATGTIDNDDVRVRVGDVSIVEGNAGDVMLDFVVKLSTASPHEVTIDYTTEDPNLISATGPPDFDAQMGTLTFAPGETSKSVNVAVHGDLLGELDESFLLKLTSPTNATISRGTATGTILNDDASLRIADMTILEGANGTTAQMLFTVTLDHGPASGDVTVDVMTMDGTAFQSSDFVQLTTTPLTFAPGETTKTVAVTVNGDSTTEQNENFQVVLSNASANATIARGTATGTIQNDDGNVFTIDNVTVTETDSGSRDVTFTLTRISGSALATNITLNTVSGTATSGGANPDFIALTDSFNVGAQFTTRTITVEVRGDLAKEGTETFDLLLSSTTPGVTFLNSTGVATILDNDPLPTVSIANAAITEGEGGSSYLIFEATLSQLSSDFVTVSFATQNASGAAHLATASVDYTAISDGTITFEPGQTKTAVRIPILGDTTDEFDETFAVALSNPAGASLGTATAIGTIQNDEVTLSIGGDVMMVEGNNGTITYMFPVSLNQAPVGHSVTVNFATQNDTTTTTGPRPDYLAQSGTLTFPEGSAAPQTISVTVNGDALVEGDERFFVNLLQPANAKIVRGQASGTITNDDIPVPNASVSIVGDVQVLEGGDGSTTQAVFTVMLNNGPATGDVIVDFTTIDGTATLATNDFGLPSTGTVTFLPGQTSKTISVPVKGDFTAEANETFQVQLTASNAAIEQSTATATILNDDGAVFTINDVTITEGDNGTSNAVFLVRLLNTPSSAVTVDVATMDGTATIAGNDYNALALEPPTKLTFAAGTTQLQQVVSVQIRGDLIREATETFRVLLSNPTGGATIAKAEGIGTILDNNDPLPTISLSNATLAEGDSGTSILSFKARLSQPSESPVTVSFSTQDGLGAQGATAASGDYSAVLGGSVTFQPGQIEVDVPVAINGDTTDEFDETFGVTLFNPVGATLSSASAIGTIQNDEVRLTLTELNETQAEGNTGTTVFTFQVSLNQAPIGHPVTVGFQTVDDTAFSTGVNPDYVAKTGTLTFLAGDNTPQTVSITVNGDLRGEANEEFLLKLLSPVNATISDGEGEAVGTITNDDLTKVSILDAQIREGDPTTTELSFTVQLDAPSDLPVSVKVSATPGTATAGSTGDYLNIPVANQTIMFAAGETMKTVKVPIVNDSNDEPTETFSVSLDAPMSATLDRATAIGTILDDDARTLSISNASVSEGQAGTKFLTFTVTLSQASQQTVMVDYATADFSALAGQDYDATSGTLVIEPNQASKTIMIPIRGDTTVEGNETFILNLFNAQNAILAADTHAVGTIVDDESTVKLVPVTSTMVGEESGSVQFRVVREGDLSQAVTVQYRTVDGLATGSAPRADFTAKTGIISFAAGSAAETLGTVITIPITADQNYEFDETFRVELFNPVNAGVLRTDGSIEATGFETVTILDNDLLPTVTILDPVPVTEGNSGTQNLVFTVKLSAANEREDVTVNFQTQDIPGEANSLENDPLRLVDYVRRSPADLRILKGATEGTITIVINGDIRDESDEESFEVKLNSALNAILPAEGLVGTGTIKDNDAAPTITFASSSGANITLAEGDAGVTNATFTLQLSEISERPVSVKVSTRNGTAGSGGANPDYDALVDFPAEYQAGNGKEFTFSVPVRGDMLDEGNESFSVVLSDAQFATLGSTTTGTATITDNDPAPVITVNDVSVQEGNDGTTDLVFTVSLSAASEQTVKVDFKTGTGGTASATGPLADYVAKDGTLKFLPGELTKEVRVKVNGDTFKEAAETFTLGLSGAVNGTILSNANFGTGTILNDGDSTVGIAIGNGFVAEGNVGTTLNFTVELSETLTTATVFRVVTTNGTAVSGRDFVGVNGTEFTIPANMKSITVPVTVIGEGAFEATESFFASLRGVPDGIVVIDGKGRGTIFNDDARRVDSHTLQFVDVDGDLVTVRVSKGVLRLANLEFSSPNSIGGRQIQTINLTSGNNQFQNTDLSVNAGKQKGFNGDAQGRKGDGHVNVGLVLAAIPQPDLFQVLNGIDLGRVQIDGDVGRIFAGDVFATPAIESLEVRSFGRLGASTQGAGGNTVSLVLGPVNNLHVAGNFAGSFRVIGDIFGSIKNLHIGGALLGGDGDQSGRIEFTGKLRNGYIGRVEGGEGDGSGTIFGSLGSIGKLRVGGTVAGGSGAGSGEISAPTITSLKIRGLIGGTGDQSGQIDAQFVENLVVTGNVRGGAGEQSGQIIATSGIGTVDVRGEVRGGSGDLSGVIFTEGRATNISVFGTLSGGAGESSGRIIAFEGFQKLRTGAIVGGEGIDSGSVRSDSGIQKLSVFGNIMGGSGSGSGGISILGNLRDGLIAGDIVGGDSKAGSTLVKSGFVVAVRIQDLEVQGDLIAGTNHGTGVAVSGTIFAGLIGSLHIHGSVIGNEDVAAIIAALGKSQRAAIHSLTIDGDVRFAEILAGYGGRSELSDATVDMPRGDAINADARIGTVKIGGDLRSSSIVAGVDAGTDKVFGTGDDVVIGGTGTTDAANAMSKIARIVIGGTVNAGAASAGIEAQFVKSVRVGPANVALNSGPGNDPDRTKQLAPGSNIHVFELPLPV